MLPKFLAFSQQYSLSTVQINPFTQSPIHSILSHCFQFSVKICSQSAPAEYKNLICTGIQTHSWSPVCVCVGAHAHMCNNCADNNLSTSVTKPNLLMRYTAKLAICRQIHKNHMKCIVRILLTFRIFNLVVHKVTARLPKAKY